MRTIKTMVLLVVLTAVFSVSWYYFTPPSFIATAPTAGATGHTFTLEPPQMAPQTQGQTNPRNRMVFVNFDDGRFAMTNVSGASALIPYGYRSTGVYMPYVESTEIYTDKKPPPSVARMGVSDPTLLDPYGPFSFTQNLTVNAGDLSSLDNYKLSMSTPIQIVAVRRIVPESGVSYVVTVENMRKGAASCGALTAAVTLKYDPDVLEYISCRDGYAQTTYTNNVTIAANTGTVTLNILAMPESEQRSLVYLFKTKAGVTTSTPIDLVTQASVTFSSTAANIDPGCLSTYSAIASDQSLVFDSHDPNHKIIVPEAFCLTESTDLQFRVDFQNDGYAPTNTIKIEDELDFLYALNISAAEIKDVKAYIGGVFHSSPQPVSLGHRKFRFVLPEAALNGTNQTGYGKNFSDASTRGYLEFKIHTDKLQAKPPCNAVCNRARIFFDCNPPIETNTALSKIKCADCTVCTDTLITSSEVGLIDTLSGANLPILPQGSEGENIKNFLEEYLGQGYYCKWYPDSKVSNQGSITATVKSSQATTYTLVASPATPSSVCRRVVFQRRFRVDCSGLAVTATATPTATSGCPDYWKYTINAQVTGASSPGDLLWSFGSNCQTGGLSFTQTNVSPGLYKVIVTDTNTGCSAETTVDIRAHPIVVDDNPKDCIANLVVTGGAPPYSFQWQWDGQIQPLTGSVLNSMAGKTNVVVTVTDANGCKKVFRPQSACVPPGAGNNPPLGMLSLLALGVSGVAYWLYKRRKE